SVFSTDAKLSGKEVQPNISARKIAMTSKLIYSIPFVSSADGDSTSLVNVRDHSVTHRMAQVGAVTLSMWFKCDSGKITQPQTVLLARYANFGTSTFSRLAVTVDRRRRLILHWLSYTLGRSHDILEGYSAELPTSREMPKSAWVHLACYFDTERSTHKWYWNGEMDNHRDGGKHFHALNVSNALVQSVFSKKDASIAAVGEISDLKIFPRQLDITEISKEFRRGRQQLNMG
ncbi:hypothetical protein Pmar_PMAR001677, partial [Perkinsus marinus ATCC 50983]